MSWTGAVFRPTGAVCVRSREVHGSHQLCFWPDQDVLYCTVCGCYSTSQLRELATECSYKLAKAGAQNLSRIGRGILPGSCVWGRERQERRERGSGQRGESAAAVARRAAFNSDVAVGAARRRPASAPPRPSAAAARP
eukprot:205406-Pyramimonas_sp.AAC.1